MTQVAPGPKMTHKHTHITLLDLNRVLRINNKNHAQISEKSHKNHLKLTPGGSRGRSCGHSSPQVPAGQKKRRKNAKIGGSTGYPEGPENRYFRVKTQTKPDGKGSMIIAPFLCIFLGLFGLILTRF